MQEKYSNIITEFLKSHSLISVNKIEEKLKIPPGTVAQAMAGNRFIPEKHIFPIIAHLADYGIKLEGYEVEYDPVGNLITGRKWIENIKTIEKDGGFEYIVKEYRFLASGYFDLM